VSAAIIEHSRHVFAGRADPMDWMAGHRGVKQAVLADDAGGRAYLGTSPEPLVEAG